MNWPNRGKATAHTKPAPLKKRYWSVCWRRHDYRHLPVTDSHGAWAHWYNGNTGKVFNFSQYDDGGDLVETAFLTQGLLTARQYFINGNDKEKALSSRITKLWEDIDWNWYTDGTDSLYWHWSKNYGFKMRHRIKGFDETLITYVLAASSPTHPIRPEVFNCWKTSPYYQNGKSYFGIPLSLGMLLSSCNNNWLSPSPENQLIKQDSTFLIPANAEKFVNACYNQLLQWQTNSFSFIGYSSITSDDADKGSDPGDLGSDKDQMDNITYTSTSGSIGEAWTGNFNGVTRCNQAIVNVPKYSISDNLKTRYIAEARFLRALYYFNLVRCFGDVPLITKVIDVTNTADLTLVNTRTPKDKVYAAIEDDLNFAISNLPKNTDYSAADLGRATKGAATALLAKVAMGRLRMYNDYLPTYKAAVDAGVGSVMASFNEVDGIPATANRWLQTEVLRNQWGFGGFVVTDFTGINEIVNHEFIQRHQRDTRHSQ